MTSGSAARGLSLAQVLYSRDNNLNLLRLIAASMVLYSHSFALVSGTAEAEPWRAWGVTPGSVAVDVFFIVSGMLVTASILRTRSALTFAIARVFRIVPGLFVALLLTVLVIGTVYFDGNTWRLLRDTDAAWYVARNSVPLLGIVKEISGGVIFAGNPFGSEFNGSLWTLPIETGLYALLLAVWAVSRWPRHADRVFAGLIAAALVFCLAKHLRYAVYGPVDFSTFRLPFMFLAGCAAALGARHVRLSGVGLVAVGAAIALSALDVDTFYVVYSLGLWYLVLCLAYVPSGAIRGYNRVGDYSYGIYIYAWPVQQSLIAAFPGISLPAHIAASAIVTLGLAVASWHLVEEPAMRMRSVIRSFVPRLAS